MIKKDQDMFVAWVNTGFPEVEDEIEEFLSCTVWELEDDELVEIAPHLITAIDHEIDSKPDHLYYACATDASFVHLVATYGKTHDVVGLMTQAADGPENLEMVVRLLVRLDLHLPKKYVQAYITHNDNYSPDEWLAPTLAAYLERGDALTDAVTG